MFKELIVDRVFDGVAASSAALENLAWFLAGEDQDRIAMLVVAACCMLVAVCHQMLARGGRVWQCARWFVIPTASLLAGQALLLHLGASRSFMEPGRIEKKQGLAFRYQIKKDMADKAASWDRWVCRAPGLFSLERAFVSSRDMREAKSIQHVADRGGGLYRIRDGGLWFSTPDGMDPRSGRARFYLVCDRPWRQPLSAGLGIAYVFSGIGLAGWRLGPGVRRLIASLFRDWRFAALAGAFLVYFGAHQMRFLHQDHRMQLVTSRDDDGYMMGRLMQAAELKTMDPNVVGNVAYASIGYFPFAALPCAAGHLGLPVSIEALNLHVRGLKILISLGMLAAVWLMAKRHFGTATAVFAVAVLMTNQGFLQYSSYPFYPDILMAAASTAAVSFTLVLAGRWNDRAFFLAVFFAAFSVSIKFITFLLFPLLAVVAAVSMWRECGGQWRSAARFAALRAAIALVLCLAVYFLLNPHLRYNYETLVPSWKDFYGYYAIETPFLVAGAAATISTWITSCYAAGADRLEAILVFFAVASALTAAVVLAAGKRVRPSSLFAGWLPDRARSLVIIGSLCVLFQLYLFSAVTLPESIDARMVMPILPLVCMAAASLPAAILPRLKFPRAAMWVAIAAAAWLLWPRLDNLREFYRHFGRVPDESPLADFLADIQAPPSQGILTSLQAYIPAKFTTVTDGEWQTAKVASRLFREASLPALFIEDEAYYNQFFSDAAAGRGFHTALQKKMHAEGQDLYLSFRRGIVPPFVHVQSGSEVLGTNDRTWLRTDYHAYASRLAFGENLILRGEQPAAPAAGALRAVAWPRPTTLSCLHVSTKGAPASAQMQARFKSPDGEMTELSFQAGLPDMRTSTQHFILLDPPRDFVSFEILDAGFQAANASVNEMSAIGPLPLSPNPVAGSFTLAGPQREAGGWDHLIHWRPGASKEAVIPPSGELRFSLSSAAAPVATQWLVVLDGADAGPLQAECRCEFAGGEPKNLPVRIQRSSNPDHTAFVFDVPSDRPLLRCEIALRNPSAGTVKASLRQIAARLIPTAPK